MNTGFPELSRRLAIHPDYETFIFRKFDKLCARNLLHLESELAYLEWKLDQADKKAIESQDNETLRSIRVWEAFRNNAKDQARSEHDHMSIAEDIRETLKEYQETLLRQHQIATLPAPKKRALSVASHLLHDSTSALGHNRKIIAGLAETRLDESNHQDLLTIRRPSEKDPLSRFLQDNWMFKTTKITRTTEQISEPHVSLLVALVDIIIAAILLIGAVTLLYNIDRKPTQLGLIAMFTTLFAASVGILTNARRAEVFGATAAYAAVLVVFVSSTGGGGVGGNCVCGG